MNLLRVRRTFLPHVRASVSEGRKRRPDKLHDREDDEGEAKFRGTQRPASKDRRRSSGRGGRCRGRIRRSRNPSTEPKTAWPPDPRPKPTPQPSTPSRPNL